MPQSHTRMNDEPQTPSVDDDWDTFGDDGPDVLEDSLFQQRFSAGDTVEDYVEGLGTDAVRLSAVPEYRLDALDSGASQSGDAAIPQAQPVASAEASPDVTDTTRPYGASELAGASQAHEPQVSASSTLLANDTDGAVVVGSRKQTLGSEAKSHSRPRTHTPSEGTEPGDGLGPDLGGSGSHDSNQLGDESDDNTENTPHTTVNEVEPETKDESAPSAADGSGPIDTLSAAYENPAVTITILAVAANEYIKEVVCQELREVERPPALVAAETFIQAVQATFTEPAPGERPAAGPQTDVRGKSNEGHTVSGSNEGLGSANTMPDEGYSLEEQRWFGGS